MLVDRFIWAQIPTLAPGGVPPGAVGGSGPSRRAGFRADTSARRLQAERAAIAAVTAAGERRAGGS